LAEADAAGFFEGRERADFNGYG
jgi:hypothetical protein